MTASIYRSRRAAIALFIALSPPISALAQDPGYGKVRLACDAAASSMEIGDWGAPESRGASRQAPSTIIDWHALIRMGPQKNQRGEPLRTGTRTVTHRCGLYTARIKGGYLSPNTSGESGAIEFPVVEVLMDRTLVVPPTALDRCEQALPRYEGYAPCPKGWALAMRVVWNAKERKTKVSIQRAYEDRAYEERTVIDELEVAADQKR
jgi:hypothetical protein